MYNNKENIVRNVDIRRIKQSDKVSTSSVHQSRKAGEEKTKNKASFSGVSSGHKLDGKGTQQSSGFVFHKLLKGYLKKNSRNIMRSP